MNADVVAAIVMGLIGTGCGAWMIIETYVQAYEAKRRQLEEKIRNAYIGALGLDRPLPPVRELDSWELAGLESTDAMIRRIDREIQKGYEAWLEGSVAVQHPNNREIEERPVGGHVTVKTYGRILA